MGRQAELGSGWCPPGLYHRQKAGGGSIQNKRSVSSVQARTHPTPASVAAANTKWFRSENRDELRAQASAHFRPHEEMPLSARTGGPRARSAPLWESPWTPRAPPLPAAVRGGFVGDDAYFRPESAPPDVWPENFGGKTSTSRWPSSEPSLNRDSFNSLVNRVPCIPASTMRKEAQLGQRPSTSLGTARLPAPESFASLSPAGFGESSRGAARPGIVPVAAWT